MVGGRERQGKQGKEESLVLGEIRVTWSCVKKRRRSAGPGPGKCRQRSRERQGQDSVEVYGGRGGYTFFLSVPGVG